MNMPMPTLIPNQPKLPPANLLDRQTRQEIRHRLAGENPRQSYLERYEPEGPDDLAVVDDGQGNLWLNLKNCADRESLQLLIQVTQGHPGNHAGRGWFHDHDDATDECRWISQELIDELGPRLINDIGQLGKSLSSQMIDYLGTRFAKRVNEVDGPAKLLLSTWRRWRRSRTKYMQMPTNDELSHTPNGAFKVLRMMFNRGNVGVEVEGLLYQSDGRFMRMKTCIGIHHEFPFIERYGKLTAVYDHIMALSGTDGTVTGRLDGVYTRALVDMDDDKERARAITQEHSSMWATMNGASTATVEEHQHQVAVLDHGQLDGENQQLHARLLPMSIIVLDRDVEPEGIECASVWNHGLWFGLEKKNWLSGPITTAAALTYDRHIIDQVIMSPIRKQALLALVETPTLDLDMIENKGNNTTFLLSGSPGTGKTLTAEAVAQRLGCPLLKVSFGELGTTTSQVEARMRRYLGYANRWGLVVLLDEADVFLERRDNNNLERTALVAAFLSLLEYYRGVLFLTTNRTDTIDPAIHSRMALSLSYQKEDLDSAQVWRDLLKKAGIKSVGRRQLQTLVDLDLNGREIKNLLATGARIAQHQGIKFNVDLIQEVRKLYQ